MPTFISTILCINTLLPPNGSCMPRVKSSEESFTLWTKAGLVARPLFSWNHNIVMKAGYEGLKKKITDAG
ncbi:MAG: hypothetical protein SH808_11175 [Saprospiraceae bacterium]|nr:hypothetical protein [Saprospiraceae bacterium]